MSLELWYCLLHKDKVLLYRSGKEEKKESTIKCSFLRHKKNTIESFEMKTIQNDPRKQTTANLQAQSSLYWIN
jgi:hypothetical protein